jgi:hypothetical protein
MANLSFFSPFFFFFVVDCEHTRSSAEEGNGACLRLSWLFGVIGLLAIYWACWQYNLVMMT